MTEREKMVRGLLYWPGDGELAEARDRCKTLCQQFNQLVYRDMDAACAALNEALPHAGQGFWMEPPLLVRLRLEHHRRQKPLHEPRLRHPGCRRRHLRG